MINVSFVKLDLMAELLHWITVVPNKVTIECMMSHKYLRPFNPSCLGTSQDGQCGNSDGNV